MKKRIGMLTVIGCIFFSGMFVGGCRMPDTVKGTLSSDGTIYDVESYKLSGDVTFLPISVQKIDNHSAESTVITEFVNIKDKTVWMQSYKGYYRADSGVGQSMVQELDPDGKPKLYSGDINELIKKFQNEKCNLVFRGTIYSFYQFTAYGRQTEIKEIMMCLF